MPWINDIHMCRNAAPVYKHRTHTITRVHCDVIRIYTTTQAHTHRTHWYYYYQHNARIVSIISFVFFLHFFFLFFLCFWLLYTQIQLDNFQFINVDWSQHPNSKDIIHLWHGWKKNWTTFLWCVFIVILAITLYKWH